MAEPKKEEVKPKGPLGKLKEAVDDKEEQMAILSTFVRLGILIWAASMLEARAAPKQEPTVVATTPRSSPPNRRRSISRRSSTVYPAR